MHLRRYWLFAIALLITSSGFAQSARSLARKGNQAYKKEAYSEAEVKFRKSLKAGSDFNKARYNLANTLIKQKRYKQAAQKFNEVVENAESKAVKAKAYHNMGNAFLKAQKLDKSIKAYKNALRLNPQNEEARYNLSYALKKRKQKQKQQKQRKKQKKKSNKKQHKGKKQKGNKKQKKQAKKNQRKKQNQRQKQNKEKRQQQPQKQQKAQKTGAKKGDKQQMSKRQMQQILKAIQANEADLQRKILKKKRKGSPQSDNQKEW